MTREERLSDLAKVPTIASVDHRYFLDEDGRDVRTSSLPRRLRKRMEAEGRRIAGRYNQILRRLCTSGVGYPVDKLLRSMAVEYTHRYAASGTMTQPVSFNYFESFCSIRLIEKSTAPYAEPRGEYNHLFSVVDFFDHLTSEEKPDFKPSELLNLPEGTIYHFTQNGSVTDFTYFNPRGKEFVISGFSMIRHGASLHWYMIGGEIFSANELEGLKSDDRELNKAEVPPPKRKFLEQAMRERGDRAGPPIFLEGTENAVRTMIAGEFDLLTRKHLARCYMKETENTYAVASDDPDIFHYTRDAAKRDEILSSMKSQLDEVSVMWDLAEGFFQLPRYFEFRLTVPEKTVEASGLTRPKTTKGGRGVGADFRHVASVAISEVAPHLLASYTPPPLEVETQGYWHRLDRKAIGHDRDGKPVRGRDWIKADVSWRARPTETETVFIKSTVGAAKVAIADYVRAAQDVEKNDKGEAQSGVLYVMRCMAMNDEVYKVGWTSKSAEERAKELSTTGVPVPFKVIEYWKHDDPAALETGVHALLDPYRIAGNREFFKLRHSELKSLIEQEIARTNA
jgi:hypothetical protein